MIHQSLLCVLCSNQNEFAQYHALLVHANAVSGMSFMAPNCRPQHRYAKLSSVQKYPTFGNNIILTCLCLCYKHVTWSWAKTFPSAKSTNTTTLLCVGSRFWIFPIHFSPAWSRYYFSPNRVCHWLPQLCLEWLLPIWNQSSLRNRKEW